MTSKVKKTGLLQNFFKHQRFIPENVIGYTRGDNVSQRFYIRGNRFSNAECIKITETVVNVHGSENIAPVIPSEETYWRMSAG